MSVTLVILHAQLKRRILLSSVVCPAVRYFSTLSHKRHISVKSYWTQNVFWFSVQFSSGTFLILRTIQRDIINVRRACVISGFRSEVRRELYWYSYMIYLSTAVVLTPGGSTHLHTNNKQNNTINNKTTRITNKITQITNLEECWPCTVFVNYTLAFALQLRKKHGKTSVRVVFVGCNLHDLSSLDRCV
jgi:hypothetical protein